MRRVGRLILFLAVFILLAVLCVVGGMRFGLIPGLGGEGGGAGAEAAPAVETTQVVLLAQPAKRGQRITEDMVALVDIPTDTFVPTMLVNPDDVVGKLAARDLPQGIFLTQGDVVDTAAALFEGAGSIAAAQIPPGYVAISIPISRLTSVSYAIQPGDRVGVMVSLPFVDVDPEFQAVLPNLTAAVIGNAVWVSAGEDMGGGVMSAETLQTFVQQVTAAGGPVGRAETDGDFNLYVVPSEAQRPRLVTQLIIEDARVLHVGDFLERKPQPTPEPQQEGQQMQAEQQQPQTPEAPAAPDVVTLIVTPQDAVTIKYLLDRHMILTLVLRGADDEGPLETEAVTLTYLLDEYRLVIPSKEPFDLAPRTDTVTWPDEFRYVEPTPQPEQ
ncbi:MAG: hypothetical protein GXO37_06845 [Chloroflexi bacterium]|nr:hypothetical protein [Chloroflexota bacterium]